MRTLFLLVCFLAPAPDDWESRVRGLRPQDSSAREKAVLDNLEQRAKRSLAAIRHAEDRRQADDQRVDLRRRLQRSLGYQRLPWPLKLNARTSGELRRQGYLIEKTVFETLPGVQVPAHVYRPARSRGRLPAVLFYTGHWWEDSKARPDFQAFCINMARFGFVVMAFDAFGQGERGVSWRDHRRTEALLVGVSQQGFAEHETQRALRYLVSRADVDPSRLGMTGASGGGYNTWITSALEDSIQVAVPVVGTSEFLEQIRVTRKLDWYHASEHCHFVPGLIRYANNHELLAMVAPRPLLIIAATEDQSFPIGGVREVAGYGARLYESWGLRDRFGFFEDSSSGHGYQKAKREAAYGWFLKWLKGKGDGRPVPEPPTETEPPDSVELRCFPPGRNSPAGPGMIDAVRLFIRDPRRGANPDQREESQAASTRQKPEGPLARNLPPPAPRFAMDAVFGEMPESPQSRIVVRDERLQRLVIPVEPGLEIPAFLARPEGEAKGLAIAMDDRGKEAIAAEPSFNRLLGEGWAVCGLDPRGIGELATTQMGWVSAVSLLLGENFVSRQGCDVRRSARALAASEPFEGKPLGLYARGPNAALAATYLLAQEARGRRLPVRWYVLRDGFVSYQQFLDRPQSIEQSFRLQSSSKERFTPYDREIPFHFFPFRVLSHFDLPQLLGESSARGLIVNPIDGDWLPMSEPDARKLAPANVKVVVDGDPESSILELTRMPSASSAPPR